MCLLGLTVLGAGASDSPNRVAASSTSRVATVVPGAPAKTTPKPAKNQPASAGTAVRDGKFEFRVTAVEQGATMLGHGFWSEHATGEFVVVRLRITNIGSEARTFHSGNQYLFDDRNRKFDSSFGANMALSDDVGFTELNPGLSVSTVVVFDVPPGTTPAVLRFHDSSFSGGASVFAR